MKRTDINQKCYEFTITISVLRDKDYLHTTQGLSGCPFASPAVFFKNMSIGSFYVNVSLPLFCHCQLRYDHFSSFCVTWQANQAMRIHACVRAWVHALAHQYSFLQVCSSTSPGTRRSSYCYHYNTALGHYIIPCFPTYLQGLARLNKLSAKSVM